MPGILPMKVIKIGTNSQSRIAQACDRCRSKKIRCDGVTPCCTQCKNVGFECKTSDKLSRRAFPRGYTESLEERVRSLESEVRELKDLLDEKDEKIDMLSKVQSFSTRRPSVASPPLSEPSPKPESREDTFKVQQIPNLQKSEHKTDPYFVGASSTRYFVDTMRTKIQEKGRSISNLDTNALIGRCDLARPAKRADLSNHVPRLASDQLVNVFFQEWMPLLPVLHRPTFLNIYTGYLEDTQGIKDPSHIAQLNLVFGIAALANESNKELLPYFEAQWQGAIGAIINETKLSTLQSLVLAMLYCIVRGDSNKLVFYSGVAVNMSRRLGLHQSQKRFSLGALTRETRKKVFWSLYTLDTFGAIALGLPRLLKDEDLETEEPADVDDENVTERGFSNTLPGESTKLSSALALFRLARVLAKVQTELYPGASSYDLSLSKVGDLTAELDAWRNDLAPHLRLEFVKDKPSTNIISSRCPLLGLLYHYVRMLIHRPVLYSNLSSQASSSVLAVAESSKHIVQILQLLQERSLSCTIPINRSELIISCGFGLIYHLTELTPDSKLNNDTQQYINASVDLLEQSHAPAVISFRKIAQTFTPAESAASSRSTSSNTSPKTSSELQRPVASKESTRTQLQALAAKLSFSGMRNFKNRAQAIKTEQSSFKSGYMIGRSGNFVHNASTANIPSQIQDSRLSASSEPALKHRMSTPALNNNQMSSWNAALNLDYLALGAPNSMMSSTMSSTNTMSSDFSQNWESLMATMNPATAAEISCQQQQYTSSPQFHPRTSVDSYQTTPPVQLDWNLEWTTPDTWALFEQPVSAKSVLSFSDESTSGEDLSSCDMGSEFRGYSISTEDFYCGGQVAGSPEVMNA